MVRHFSVLLCVLFVFAACGPAPEGYENTTSSVDTSSPVAATGRLPQSGAGSEVTPKPEWANGQEYIYTIVRQVITTILEDGMGEEEKAKAAFDHLVENTTFGPPLGQDIWRIRGEAGANEPLPTYVENRALSVLLFGVGYCEDYAAALTILLQGMGIEAQYMPGLTYTVEGELVDHAWTLAKIDGIWYHLDSQLEDNITRDNQLAYKYFMRGDESMRASHFWGQNLIDSGLLDAAQNQEIRQSYLGEPCPQDYTTPNARTINKVEAPNPNALAKQIEDERAAYEAVHGPLEAIELAVTPPVFGAEGYGPYSLGMA